ncbi:Kae1-associated serine/threonine protein kinase [Candidatus Pacearchaeota archaeon]|nr:Kae1-associated serine/threonine protein kinase [Candidatus Pacearchaeota archaeon]
MARKRIIAQGAEALILQERNRIFKERVKKSYRLPILDYTLRRQRTRTEAKFLERARKIVPVPQVLSFSEYSITLEVLQGENLSSNLGKLKNKKEIAKQIGTNLARLHDAGIIHGDVTTSNMIYLKNKVFFIDFGLGFISSRVEDKATDLHVLKEALQAKHYLFVEELWSNIIKAYKEESAHASAIVKQLEKVENRGRYKKQY